MKIGTAITLGAAAVATPIAISSILKFKKEVSKISDETELKIKDVEIESSRIDEMAENLKDGCTEEEYDEYIENVKNFNKTIDDICRDNERATENAKNDFTEKIESLGEGLDWVELMSDLATISTATVATICGGPIGGFLGAIGSVAANKAITKLIEDKIAPWYFSKCMTKEN